MNSLDQNLRLIADRYYSTSLTTEQYTDDQYSWFPSRLNHFQRPHKELPLRYLTNAKYQSPKNTHLILYIGGEGPLSKNSVHGGLVETIAKQYSAIIFALEHRFYGESYPRSNITAYAPKKSSAEDMVYLSSQQALEDIAFFLQQFPPSIKVIVVGGSYPGALAAWARYKYPHLIDAGVASSAPVLAKSNFWEYDHALANTIGKQCTAAIRNVITELENIPQVRRSSLIEKWGCETNLDMASFMYVLADVIAFVVQYSNPGSDLSKELCAPEFLNGTESQLDYFKGFVSRFFGKVATCQELDITHDSLRWTNNRGSMRAWMWQSCSEFGYWQVYSENGVRSHLIDESWHLKSVCTSLFGLPGTGVSHSNQFYGGLNIWNHASNIVFTNGSKDPWRLLSITNGTDTRNAHILIKGAAHCGDLGSSESKELREARSFILRQIEKWIK